MNADASLDAGVDVRRPVSKEGSDVEDQEKTAARLSDTALLGQDVVPEHRVLFRVSFSLMKSVTKPSEMFLICLVANLRRN